MQKLIFDVETNGFLAKTDRMHCMVIRDVTNPDVDKRTRHVFRKREAGEYEFYRRNPDGSFFLENPEDPTSRVRDRQYFDAEDTIADGVAMLEAAGMQIGHNIIDFDLRVVKKLFPDFASSAKVMDTLVLARVITPDTKPLDFRLNQKGMFPGYLIGKHSLDAWGWRLGKHKGDYMKDCAKLGIDPWAAWNPDMENYCINDVDVNEILWAAIERDLPPEKCIEGEHKMNDLASVMRTNGFPFDKAAAQTLQSQLEVVAEKLNADLCAKYGTWFAPEKRKVIAPLWDDNDGVNKAKTYASPDEEWGEDDSRAWWGAMVFPKVTRRRAERIAAWKAKNDKLVVKGKDPLPLPSNINLPDVTAGCPYVPIKLKEFNPNSRLHIIDRFTTLHDWVPQDFTEKGSPEVNDAVLLALKDKIPEAEPLSELFFYNKLLGQLAYGKESWINNCAEDGRIHGYINTNGAVTGRCTHAAPNMSQVPSVMKDKAGNILLGREGEFGWECRSLFYVPDPFVQVGADLSNIEARAFAAVLAEFDGGKLAAELAEGLDLHDLNMAATGIHQRSIMKRVFFGLLYGAGDIKLGLTADPQLSERKARELGAYYRSLIMNKIPGFKEADAKIKKQAARGYLIGLDGRKLGCRSEHSALNLRLQSDAALIAKRWLVATEEAALNAGMDHGWEGDFAMMGFYHDEQQNAVLKQYANFFAELAVAEAPKAGEYYEFGCAVKAEAKIGHNWAECH